MNIKLQHKITFTSFLLQSPTTATKETPKKTYGAPGRKHTTVPVWNVTSIFLYLVSSSIAHKTQNMNGWMTQKYQNRQAVPFVIHNCTHTHEHIYAHSYKQQSVVWLLWGIFHIYYHRQPTASTQYPTAMLLTALLKSNLKRRKKWVWMVYTLLYVNSFYYFPYRSFLFLFWQYSSAVSKFRRPSMGMTPV